MQILRASGDRQIAALTILFSKFPITEQEERLQDALASAARGALDLTGLWLAEIDGLPVGATLLMHQADGVSLVWPPVATDDAALPSGIRSHALSEFAIRSALMQTVVDELDRTAVQFGQCLLSPEEVKEAELLREFGFEATAELFFLARGLEEPWPAVEPLPDAQLEQFEESTNRERFAKLIERTYVDSLDCPRLNGTRTGRDAIAGHRLSGEFHPRGWRLYRTAGRDAAILLLNEHPDQDAVELVYFGVAPECRGEGWGRRLISDALAASQSWRRAAVFLAVDAANRYANEIYAEFGFQELARRIVWLRFPDARRRP